VGNVVAATNADRRLELLARGADDAAWHASQEKPSGSWAGWSRIGGALTSELTVGSNQDGRHEAFAYGADGALDHAWQTSANGKWSSSFIPVGGQPLP
jgi:hypothetical protein